MFTNRLSTKFVIPISILIVATSSISGLIFIKHQSNILLLSIQEKADTLARNLAYNAEYGVLLKDNSILQGLVEGIVKEKDVDWVEITDKEGHPLTASGERKSPCYETEAGIVVRKSRDKGSSMEQLFLPEKPQDLKEEMVGHVRLAISLLETNRKIQDLKIKAVLLFLTQMVLAIGIILVLTKTITSPLGKLALVTKKIIAGDFTIRAEVNTKDEIGHLADSFNQMVENLQKTTISKDYMDAIINNMVDGLIVFNPEWTIEMVNQAAKQILGFDDQLIGKSVYSVFPPETAAQNQVTFENLAQNEVFKDIELNAAHKSGAKVPILLSGSCLTDKDNHLNKIVCILKDMTERKKLQAILIQSEKMSAIGQLAAGVSHEINNPLGIILGFAQGMSQRIKPGEPLEMPVKTIEREAIRCKNLVQDLLTFSRADKSESVPVDLNAAIEGALSMIGANSKMSSVTIKKELGSGIPRILGNQNRLQQVVINLANNAIDAMPKGGTLGIVTEVQKDPVQSWVCLKVSDTGTGIPEEVQSKIFEPFFTTKPVGKGTGLGLSLVFDIVRKHSATIELKSQPGFTEFCVKFPVRTG